jgi:hypothetical protein
MRKDGVVLKDQNFIGEPLKPQSLHIIFADFFVAFARPTFLL